MPLQFNVKITEKDMYRFNMYHTYTTMQGYLSIFIAIGIFIVSTLTFGTIETVYTVLYYCFSVVFLFYFPVILYLKSKSQIHASAILQEPLHYEFREEGLFVSSEVVTSIEESEQEQEEEDPIVLDAALQSSTLKWSDIYKIVTTKNELYIFSNKINAYIIPKSYVEHDIAAIKELLARNVENYRVQVKWK